MATAPASSAGTEAINALVRVHIPSDAKRLVRSIFAKSDPRDVAKKLLDGDGNATSARIFTLLMEYLYGKPLSRLDESGERPFVFDYISRVPRPPSELALKAAAERAAASPDGNAGDDDDEGDPHDTL